MKPLLAFARSLLVLAIAIPSIAVGMSAPASADDPTVVGQWGAPFNLGSIAIHLTLMPNGQVLMFHRPNKHPGSGAFVWDPATGSLTDVSLLTQDDVFCAGQSVLSDGRVLVAGGHQYKVNGAVGINSTFIFDPSTDTWTRGPDMSEYRWYPTNVELADGRTLVVGGQKDPVTKAVVLEAFDPTTNTITPLPAGANKMLGNYPRMFLLPNGKIYKVGPSPAVFPFDPATNTWGAPGAKMSYGARLAGNDVLLPGLTNILAIGGELTGTSPATNTTEIIDLSASKPAWRPSAPMQYARGWGNAVLTADGKVLEIGGGLTGLYEDPARRAEMFDPATETWTAMASQTSSRMYHSTAVLLPDGRVLSAGQDVNSYAYQGEVYSPPYLFKGPRPTIIDAPSSVVYGDPMLVSTPDAASISRVALIAPGASTHAVNFGQRYVDLSFSQTAPGTITAVAPPDANHAPPGWYMLMVVNSSGVPSVASWVHVGAAGAPHDQIKVPKMPPSKVWMTARSDGTFPGGRSPSSPAGPQAAGQVADPSAWAVRVLQRKDAAGPLPPSAGVFILVPTQPPGSAGGPQPVVLWLCHFPDEDVGATTGPGAPAPAAGSGAEALSIAYDG